MIKTLLIHPKDTTTDFLKKIYSSKNWTVIDYEIPEKGLIHEIENHDRIIMMGHGNSDGLLGFGRHVIHKEFVNLLLEKETVCIWCNADEFVEFHELGGFYTGMIISEIKEAFFCNVQASQYEIEFSNKLFAISIKEAIDLENKLETVISLYSSILHNPIIEFNRKNIYQHD